MEIQRLSSECKVALEQHLLQAVDPNLFLLGILREYNLDRLYWYGVLEEGQVRAAVLALPPKLVVPSEGEPVLFAALGQHLRKRFQPMMLIGPRSPSDALWRTWAGRTPPVRWYDQRLYVCRQTPPGPVPPIRRALVSEQRTLSEHSAHMEWEDLGVDPSVEDPAAHARSVRARIERGATWVMERDGRIVFHINVGTDIPLGVQVGGTYVPPELRGQGLATQGMRALLQALLRHRPVVSLHVNEANTAAVRVYEKVGFSVDAPYRLATVTANERR